MHISNQLKVNPLNRWRSDANHNRRATQHPYEDIADASGDLHQIVIAGRRDYSSINISNPPLKRRDGSCHEKNEKDSTPNEIDSHPNRTLVWQFDEQHAHATATCWQAPSIRSITSILETYFAPSRVHQAMQHNCLLTHHSDSSTFGVASSIPVSTVLDGFLAYADSLNLHIRFFLIGYTKYLNPDLVTIFMASYSDTSSFA